MKNINDFVLELIIRLVSGTPWFFTVLSYLAFALAIITTIPVAAATYGIDLPAWVDIFNNNLVMVSSWVAFIIARLPVTSAVKDREQLRD